jgi:hypothetical protein
MHEDKKSGFDYYHRDGVQRVVWHVGAKQLDLPLDEYLRLSFVERLLRLHEADDGADLGHSGSTEPKPSM